MLLLMGGDAFAHNDGKNGKQHLRLVKRSSRKSTGRSIQRGERGLRFEARVGVFKCSSVFSLKVLIDY